MKKTGDKRGLSSIITSLVIILLVLVAVGIVWVFLRSIIIEETEEISLSKYAVSLEIKKIVQGEGRTDITIKRGIGKGSLVGIKFIINDGENSNSFAQNTTMGELELRTFILSYSGKIKEISVVPLLITASGKVVEGNLADTSSDVSYPGETGGTAGGDEGCCVPDCTGKECGSDGCGGECLPGCYPGEICIRGTCMGNCTPDCTGKECGDDGCGSLCGLCHGNDVCIEGECICDPQCEGKECGSDGCGGVCGACVAGVVCVEGICIENCQPDCTGKECGSDGCGGDCGSCGLAEVCVEGECMPETSINTGTIYSVWPAEARTYFDSSDLPVSEADYTGYYAKFPLSSEDRCIPITDFVTPYVPSIYDKSYIELGASYTEISPGDIYEVWKSLAGCNYG